MKSVTGIESVSPEDARHLGIVRHITTSLEEGFDWSFVHDAKSLVDSAADIHLVVDYDVDGLSAGAILINYIEERKKPHTIRTYARSEGFRVKDNDLRKGALNIILDRGSPEVSSGIYDGYDVLIIDHHEIHGRIPGNVMAINPRVTGKGKMPCSSLIAHRIFGSDYNLPLAILGSLGDLCILDRETHQRLMAGWRRDTPWGKFRSPDQIRFGLIPAINSCGRMGCTDIALDFLTNPSREGMRQINRVNRERKREIAGIKPLKVLELRNVRFGLFPESAAGHISYLASRLAAGETLGIASFFDRRVGVYRMSMRHSRDVLGMIYQLPFGKTGGHGKAGGGCMNPGEIGRFLKEVDDLLNNLEKPEYPEVSPEELIFLSDELESVCLHPPVNFKGNDQWTIATNTQRKRPVFFRGVLSWGSPGRERVFAATSFAGSMTIRWLY